MRNERHGCSVAWKDVCFDLVKTEFNGENEKGIKRFGYVDIFVKSNSSSVKKRCNTVGIYIQFGTKWQEHTSCGNGYANSTKIQRATRL
jgi:hypothetical protein